MDPSFGWSPLSDDEIFVGKALIWWWVMKVMPGLPWYSQFMLVILVALFILPCFTLKSVLVWIVHFMVMLPVDQKTPAFFWWAWILNFKTKEMLGYKHLSLNSLFLCQPPCLNMEKSQPFPPLAWLENIKPKFTLKFNRKQIFKIPLK